MNICTLCREGILGESGYKDTAGVCLCKYRECYWNDFITDFDRQARYVTKRYLQNWKSQGRQRRNRLNRHSFHSASAVLVANFIVITPTLN
jgi:hypothetical protein